MEDKRKYEYVKTLTFSKDNPIIEISSKQSQIKNNNVTPPSMPKELKKK